MPTRLATLQRFIRHCGAVLVAGGLRAALLNAVLTTLLPLFGGLVRTWGAVAGNLALGAGWALLGLDLRDYGLLEGRELDPAAAG